MNKLAVSLIASIVLLAQLPLSAVLADVSSNLIANGSLEEQTSGSPSSWTNNSWGTNTASFVYEPTGQDGTKSATVRMSNYQSGDAKWSPNSVAVSPSTTYTFSDWYKSDVDSSIDAVYTTTAGKTVYKWLGNQTLSAAWKQARFTFKTPANASKVTFYHYIEANGSLTTDAYSLTTGTITPPPGPTAPTVAITAPLVGATLSGVQTISANANDAVALRSVQFQLNGVNLGAADTIAPYSLPWDTKTAIDGLHSLRAVATNTSSLQTTSSEVVVTVRNTITPPPPPPVGNNLILNPSVESVVNNQPSNWSGNGWGTNTRQLTYEANGYDGSKSIKTSITSYTNGDAKWYHDGITVTPGATYSYSNWYKSSVATEIDAMVTLANGTVQYYYLTTASASPNAWQKANAQFTAPVNAAKVTIFQVLDSVGYVQSDSFSFAAYTPGEFNRGLVSITFDDGWRNIHTNGLPLLKKYNLPSTQYLLTNTTTYPDYMTVNMMRDFQNQGSEIAAHTVSHANLTTLSPTKLNAELRDSQLFLRNNFGPQAAKNFATPYGAYNNAVVDNIKQYYRSHRSTDVGFNSKDNFDIYNIKVQNITNSVTPAQVKTWVDEAIATKTWLVLVYHEVTSTAEDPTYAVTPSNLDAELNIVKQSGVAVRTVDQVLDEIVPQL